MYLQPSAIKYANVTPIKNEEGFVIDFDTKGDFPKFGNDDDRVDLMAKDLTHQVITELKKTPAYRGAEHTLSVLTITSNVMYGKNTGATPDGRKAGESLKFGLQQSGGYDRNGLSALLNSIAKVDPNAIGCGSTVTNFMLDEQLIKNDAHFEKTVDMLETYFKMGGVHFQLTYVSKEDLMNAKVTPEDYKNLRVRVSGFSDYFVKLNESIQDNIIERTTQK